MNDNSKSDGICPYPRIEGSIGKPEEILKSLHYYIDWMTAVCKRPDDNRVHSKESVLRLLLTIQQGSLMNDNWNTHYTGE